jgi:endonuclease/exonuclease/phosphatase family metal-dependent hydrolase
MKLISTNIRFDNPADGAHDWDGRKSCLIEKLLDFNPDIISSQEGRREQLFDFEKLLKFNMVRSHRKWIEERMYPTIYSGRDIDIQSSGDIWLSETPDLAGSKSFDSAFPRLCTWIKASKDKDNFLLVNVHLDHVKEETRVEQIKVLIQEINKIREDLPLIICGDFNSIPAGKVRELLISSSLDLYDPWDKAELSSHHKFNGDTTIGDRIDWFLLSKKIKSTFIKFEQSCCAEIYPSDHFPLLIEVEFN